VTREGACDRLEQASVSGVTPEELKSVCLSFAGAREEFPFDEANSVFKVAGKIFALSRLNGVPLRISLKCEPGLAIQLRTSYASITRCGDCCLNGVSSIELCAVSWSAGKRRRADFWLPGTRLSKDR
jgi:hypothetical protein